jgi:hypothetical protein
MMRCHVINVDAKEGVLALQAMPGTLRAAGVNAVPVTLTEIKAGCIIFKPTMSVEIALCPRTRMRMMTI